MQYEAIATVALLAIILIVCTGTTAVTNGHNYIGIAENQEVVVAMRRETARIIDTESSDI